ncbi:hypothetical protein [Desulfosediminicola sp.]|uniref:hypothetical protein n=1 Tax=Desulfosediminicola sp. TaxID=2886825 RepID=UPI003AF264B6
MGKVVRVSIVVLMVFTVLTWALGAQAAIPSEIGVKEDPLVRMPGTQPAPENTTDIEAPTRCLNCHSGFNQAVEPGHNWQGSMMAQASRDFLFWACLTVSAQDSIFAIERPNATDICLRCHFPQGWLGGRSGPTNGSAMASSDFDGVHCDVCHSMYDPFFEDTFNGSREGADWLGYWDETNLSTTPSETAAQVTLEEDRLLSGTILQADGLPFFDPLNSPPANWQENGSGQYFLSDNRAKRAPFADANGRHPMLYSRYHKSKYMCSTCHDVSNPILANLDGGVLPGDTIADLGGPLVSETDSAFSFYHVERTFSEFMLSDYGLQGGAPGIGPYAPENYDTSHPDNNITRCQDCHMRDGVGKAASQRSAVNRPDGSVEHPLSGQPIHDLTGGNAWVTAVLASTDPNCQDGGVTCYDPVNENLLNQGADILTLDLTQGQGIDPVRLIDGSNRALQQLQLAASINDAAISGNTLSFKVQNQTGHKLISGFPEGRRMYLNIRFYDEAGGLVQEINPYDTVAGTFKGFVYPYAPEVESGVPWPAPLDEATEIHDDSLVYEMKPTSSLTEEEKSFHFALATGRYKDNRIPPKGFRIHEAAARLSTPVDQGADAPNYYSSAEYAGGYDDVSVAVPTGAVKADITLYYQTTSREYIEFLRDEITGTGNLTLPPGDYVVQIDPWFANLAGWGNTIWQLWKQNMNLKSAAPYQMTAASVGVPPLPCDAPIPVLDQAVAASNQVELGWSSALDPNDPDSGYNLYYDQVGKELFIADTGKATTFTDMNLINGQTYCYKVTSYTVGCESQFSNVLCATPLSPGQSFDSSAVLGPIGRLEVTGKGKNTQITFVETTTFLQGDEIMIYVTVSDADGVPIEGATVDISVVGPVTVSLTSGPTDVDGISSVSWATEAPNKKGVGGTPTGSYNVSVSGVTATDYTWDGMANAVSFTIN